MEDNFDVASEPWAAYGLSPDERNIIYEISQLRGNKDALRRILLFIRQDIKHQPEAHTGAGQRKFLKLKGIMSDYPGSDKEHLVEILQNKHLPIQ